MWKNYNGLSRPPCKLLYWLHIFHVGTFHNTIRVHLANSSLQLVHVPNFAIVQSIDQADPENSLIHKGHVAAAGIGGSANVVVVSIRFCLKETISQRLSMLGIPKKSTESGIITMWSKQVIGMSGSVSWQVSFSCGAQLVVVLLLLLLLLFFGAERQLYSFVVTLID